MRAALVLGHRWPYCGSVSLRGERPCPFRSSPFSAGRASSAATSPSGWPAPAGGCGSRCGGRTRRISSAPTASSARSSRSRPTSATRPRPARAIAGAEAVVNCVGVLAESRQADLRCAAGRGRRRGSPGSPPRRGSAPRPRLRDRRRPGERQPVCRRQGPRRGRGASRPFPGAVILRPSIVFGTEDSSSTASRAMARLSPVLPLIGAETRFQPVYVDDVAAAAASGAPPAPAGRRLRARRAGGRDLPRADAAACSGSSAAGGCWSRCRSGSRGCRRRSSTSRQRASFGLVANALLTRDQVRLLARDNVVAPGRPGLRRRSASTPTAMEAVLETYLYVYRPHGQFDAMIQESAGSRHADLTLEHQSLLVAALLGVLEGLTEFIPVSSTGHILLAGHFLGFHSTGKAFEVLIQLGAILAILRSMPAGCSRWRATLPTDPAARRFVFGGPARLPAGGGRRRVAARLHQDRALRDPGADRGHADPRRHRPALGRPAARAPDYHDVMDFPLPMALRIGLFQCLALVPGVSRSGATIVGALLLGADKRSAAEFSFFLSMPTMAGAFAYDLYKNRDVLELRRRRDDRRRLRLRLRLGRAGGARACSISSPARLRDLRLVANRGRDSRSDRACWHCEAARDSDRSA